MVVDASALIAILLAEPEADRLIEVLETGAAARIPAASLVEGASNPASRRP